MAKTQIKNYVFKPGIGATGNLYPDAYSLLSNNKTFIQKEATAWIADQVTAGAPGFVGYTYNQEKCERDVGYIIDAYLNDLRYGGNEKLYNTVKYYWDQDVAQVDGDRQPEIQTHTFIGTLITNNILTNTLYSASNTTVSQTTDTTKTAESLAITKISSLVSITVDVITNGLESLPVLESTSVSTIKIQGKVELDQILLISNTTKSEVLYNFTNVNSGGFVEFISTETSIDPDFPKYLQTTDTITVIKLNYDTSSHSSTDDIQIFVEFIENGKSVVTTRPFNFGTDAIERPRSAMPVSMLDADFEYGLQPTKWAAIGTLRGYPSIYEIPGTDTSVLTVVTDASAGTEGVGQSLITVTTVAPHGFIAGTPVTIKALEDSVPGAARAEGSFVIVETPTSNTFTYYAKSKVGSVNPTTISTTYTQLREAGFYTGASIGIPAFDVISQGSAGTLTTQLTVPSGSSVIPFDDQTPEIGSPFTTPGIGIPEGAQVTGIISQSGGGGTYITPSTIGDVAAGTSQLEMQDITGVVENLAIDRGDGTSMYIIDIEGNIVTFNNTFTEPVIGNKASYTNISGQNVASIGQNAKFDIGYASDSSFTYIINAIVNDGGEDYQVGDRIIIPGTSLGGTSPANDATIIVTEIRDSANSILSASISGTHFDNDIYLSEQTTVFAGGEGTSAAFDITMLDNTFTDVSITTGFAGAGYKVGDVIEVLGTSLSPSSGPNNNLIISVDTVGATGDITSLSFTGTAPDVDQPYNNVNYTTTSANGIDAQFNIQVIGTSYIATLTTPGTNYVPTDTITVLGTDLGGTTPANDLTITIDNVDANGAITAFTETGVAFNGQTRTEVVGSNVTPTGATFNISQNGAVYVVESGAELGDRYNIGQELIVPGTVFGASSPENDLTITVTGIDNLLTGSITAFTSAGNGYEPLGVYIDVAGVNDDNVGTGLEIEVSRENGLYGPYIISNAGADYKIGNNINIFGSQLGGISPLNDLIVRVSAVDGAGGVTAFTPVYDEAAFGDRVDLISTVTMSETTTQEILINTSIDYGALASLEVTFSNAHGLVPGNTFITTVTSDDGANNHALAAGSFFATEIPAVNKLRFQARAIGSIDTSTIAISGTIYPRPDSFFVHRPYDGGVQLGTGGPQHGAQAIRQSKKYIRYQSGKGIMYTTGALFAPSYDLRSLTADGVEVGSLITVTTDDNDHGVQPGGIIRILGVETPGFNSGNQTAVPPIFDYTVEEVIDERTFTIRAQRRLGSTDAILGFGSQMSVVSWHGATVRSGIFDDQNGLFWEFDGTNISVNQRTGTRQLAGTIELAVDDNRILGTNTRFTDQLKAGDRIIIKGMTHVVSHVNSQTEITVTPDFRGVVDITGAKANLIVDKKVKQRDFNLDRLDGTGPSGYDIDIAKMQMIGIQYSWYGAGFIDFMLRGADGNFVFAHRMRNSNVNTEAFMRSGNLPVRYEVTNEGPSGKLREEINDTQTTIPLVDSSFFPEYGTIYIDNEIINFNGKDDSINSLLGATRGATFNNFQAGANRQYTAGPAIAHSDRTGVVLISQTITPLISHWGSAFITDGGFDEDRGYIFSYAESSLDVSTTKQTAFMIRLSPSVSNALVGDLGERELLNRAQLLLQSLEITSDTGQGGIVVEGVLNPKNYPLNPSDVQWQTLSSEAQGGQPSFAQIAGGGGIKWSDGEAATTTTATAQSAVTVTAIARGFNSDDNFDVTEASYEANGPILVGSEVGGTNSDGGTMWFSGTTVRRIRDRGQRYEIDVTDDARTYHYDGDTITFRYGESLTNRNFAWFTKASFDSSGATIGTEVTSGGSVTFPANTRISNIQLLQHGNAQFYRVTFNNSFSGTLTAGSGTVEFTFIEPPYAQPGETIFSFIAQPGERATVDFSELKELTNTPLGGRGTYPNGPDVLAINVYKVSGPQISSNVILRWGEAQA